MSKVTKFLAAIASAALVISGLTVMPAQAAGSPYTVTQVKSGLEASSDLVAASDRVYWKSGNQLWTSDGTTSTSLHTFTSALSFSLTQATPQYIEGGFWDYSTFINRSVVVGNTIYFWAEDTNPNNSSEEDWNVWKSDGTVAGTVRVTNRYIPFTAGNSGDNPTSLKLVGNYIYFWDHFRDGFGTLTRNLNRINVSTGASEIVTGAPTSKPCAWQSDGAPQYQFAVIGTKLIFDYGDSGVGPDCIVHIGSLDLNTFAFERISPISVGSDLFTFSGPQDFVSMGSKLYFTGSLANGGSAQNSELWVTDGTSGGTSQLTNLRDSANYADYGVQNPKNPFMRPFTTGGFLYFVGWESAANTYSIYRTDGAATPSVWLSGTALPNAGRRTNVAPSLFLSNGTPYLVTDASNANNAQQMYSVNMTTKAVTLLTPNLDQTTDTVGDFGSGQAMDLTAPLVWNGKTWWVAGTELDNPNNGRNLYYTDGTLAGTAAATSFIGDKTDGIGYQGPGQVDQFATNATRPIVANMDALWFLRGPAGGSTWSLYKVTAGPVTPPTPPLVCAGQLSKLKVEVSNGTELSPDFNGSTCEYTIKVDSKVTKVEVTPTVGVPSNGVIKVNNATVKSTKTHPVTLNSNIQQIEIKVGASTTYLINVERSAAAAPGERDSLFTAPSLPGGSVKSVDKDEKKEVNQNGDKKTEEVTYLGGSFNDKVAKVDGNGKKDETFSSKLPEINGTVTTVKVDNQHRILVGGDFEDEDGDKDVIRLKPNGEKDKSFDAPNLGGNNARVSDIEVQKDGKVIVVGDFDDNTKSNCKRLHEDGHEDSDFESHLPDINGEVKTAKVQEDGKILLGGHFENVSDGDHDKIVRLEKDGDHDRDFKPSVYGAHFNGDVEDIETQKDGKVIVVGRSEKSNDDEADKVSRLHEDGHEDDSFVFNGNIPSGKKVEAVKVKDSGEIYIAGDFDDLGDGDGDKVAKVKKDGHVDTDWNPPHQGGDVHDIELEKHGKVFLGGEGSGDGDRCDKVHEDGDRDGDDPRYDSIDDDRASNKVDTGTKGQTKIHGDGFRDGTTVTIGGKTAKVVKIDERDEELTVQIPTPDNEHKGGSDHERTPADIVITVPNGTNIPDVIEIKEGFGYTDVKAPQVITPNNGHHINPDKDDSDGKGKVRDDESLSAHIPSDDDITHVSKTPTVCTVDDENRVHYHQRGDCKIVTDAPGDMGHVDPAPITEVTQVAGLDPLIVAPTIPDFADPSVPEVPETGFQLPAPSVAEPTIPIVYVPSNPEVCEVSADGIVTPLDSSQDCTVSISTPGTPIFEPTDPIAPPITFTVPSIAWLQPIAPSLPGLPAGTMQDPDVPSVNMPANGGTVKLSTDLAIKYDKAKGTLTPTAWGIYFGPIQATINYSWERNGVTSATYTCSVKWGVLKKWSKLSKADQKKYKKPLGAKVFTTTGNCKVNALAKAALAQPGTVFTATSDVLRIRMWPATYKPEKPIIPNVRPNPVPIEPRIRHYTLTINTN